MEVGIDIEENERFKNSSPKFLERAFTKNEIQRAERFLNKHEIYCSIWCVKEATIKAFSNRKISFQDIEVLTDDDGKPSLKKTKTILDELKRIQATDIKISISHSKNYSTAVCLIY